MWVDTDVGTNPDDGAALLVAMAHSGLEVVGVSTVSGDTGVRARIARSYVPDPGMPVVAGAGAPQDGGPTPRWFGHEGDGPLGDDGDDSHGDGDGQTRDGSATGALVERLVEAVRPRSPTS